MLFEFFIFMFLAGTSTEDETATLLNFKSQVRDPTLTLQSWSMNTTVCSSWEGVECEQDHVTDLNLHSLVGIPRDLFASTVEDLSYLRTLHVSQSTFDESVTTFNRCESLVVVELPANEMQGSFPFMSLLESCHNLKVLNISHNELGGEFPRGFFTSDSLEKLDVSNNMFEGTVVSSRFHHACKRLKYLDMSNNHLTGAVPKELLLNCTSLEEVSLADNNLSGAFPVVDTSSKLQKLNLSSNLFTRVEIVGCRYLVELNVSSNNISSPIFSSQTTCPRLKVLDIASNSFSGEFFQSLVGEEFTPREPSFLPSVEVIHASHNKFTGEVPVLVNGKLWYLDLSSNMLSSVNKSMCELSNSLESLILPNNRLTGEVLQTILKCSHLKMLDVTFNVNITGSIPETLCRDIPGLEYFIAWGNNLQGSIPPSLAQCQKLTMIFLAYNNLKGPIPPELGELNGLRWLDLTGNMLTGNIPKSFGKLSRLVSLHLNKNKLDGEIPLELGECKLLIILELSGNSLTGRLPPRLGRSQNILETVNKDRKEVNNTLGYLKIVQPLPPKCAGVVDAVAVQGIDVEDLERLISARAGCPRLRMAQMPAYLSNISSLRILDVSHNKLTGEIPVEIGEMKTLGIFYGSHNKFTGRIPDSIGNLTDMALMDLSFNQLEGRIPETVHKLSFLRMFNVSYNNLSDIIPQAGQLTTLPASSFQGNPRLCGLPLTTRCTGNGYARNPTVSGKEGSHVSELDTVLLIITITSGTIGFVMGIVFAFRSKGLNRLLYRVLYVS